MKRYLVSAAAAVGLLVASAGYANPISFFGQDQNPGSSTANSVNARNQFVSNLSSGVGTEDFQSFATNATAPITLHFPGSGTTTLTATLTGNGTVLASNSSGAYPTSGTKYYRAITGSTGTEFSIDFSASPISAFGFYGTDISDSGSDFFLTLTDTAGLTHRLNVTKDGLNNGNLLFFGFIDASLSYTNISFGSTSGGDYFGFDDMIIGDLGQVAIGVPEPGTLAMFGLGLLGMLLIARRRRYS